MSSTSKILIITLIVWQNSASFFSSAHSSLLQSLPSLFTQLYDLALTLGWSRVDKKVYSHRITVSRNTVLSVPWWNVHDARLYLPSCWSITLTCLQGEMYPSPHLCGVLVLGKRCMLMGSLHFCSSLRTFCTPSDWFSPTVSPITFRPMWS